jgi:hypothetical protein
MTITMTQEIQVADHPEFDPATEEGRELFSLIAVDMQLKNPTLCHFVFKRGAETLGEMYFISEFEETH